MSSLTSLLSRWEKYRLISVVLILAFIFSPILTASQAVYADTASLQVTAQIAPVRYAVVTAQNQITEITSNTKKNINPTYLRETLKGRAFEPSKNLTTQYQKIISSVGINRIGIIYLRKSSRSLVMRIVYKVTFGILS